jgi:hypothetical protein
MKVVSVDKALHIPNGITRNIYELYLVLITIFIVHIHNMDLVVPQFEINSTKIFGPVESIQHNINAR